ncbi:sensor histidine kinase [Emticicia fluvialis]|uniref:sensor histidine kinase n=1 Tax=Emticicia fluvialis TaxID=2974474 RepID=UPI00216649E1|nr:histidine kinase [Emticicia fluvialis]
MQSFRKFRQYEFWFILLAFTIYITRRLFEMAGEFDRDIELAESSTFGATVFSNYTHNIWNDLAGYNHEINTIFPTIAGGVLSFAAWACFHYLAYPRLKSKERKQDEIIAYLFLTVLFSAASVFFYDYFKLYWRFRTDDYEQIIGFKVYSLFRKVNLVSNTIALLTMIGIYEAASQFYYFLKNKLNEEPEKNFQYLDFLLVAFVVLAITGFAFWGQLPVSFWKSDLREGVFIPLFLATVYIAQNVFIERIIPNISNLGSKGFSAGIILFVIVCILGTLALLVVNQIFWVSNGHQGFYLNTRDFLVPFFLIVFISSIGAFLRSIFFKEKLKLTELFTRKTAELSSLRSQINPHFLFNALNTLYSVSLKENAEKTADGIQKLGDMMRFMLNENNQDRIPLYKEIEYLQNYIEIQQMRIAESDNIEIKVNIQPTDREIFVAPMLLNPFIENAFKHGISFRNPSWIYITLTYDDTRLYFKVHNSLHARSEADPEKNNNGIGLENVKKRLELIYKNRHTLDIQQSEQDFFVSLTITYW